MLPMAASVRHRPRWRRPARATGATGLILAAAAATVLGTACSGSTVPLPCAGTGKPIVVAAENFWGSIASQLAGDRACVVSVISNPDADPHAYEATPTDARLVASAGYFIENGAGYDPWAAKLLAANPVSSRTVLDVGGLVGRHPGDNPHLWYSPAYVDQFIDRVTADLQRLDPQRADDYTRLNRDYRTRQLSDYHATIAAIAARYSGVPIGATETVVSYLAGALGLNLVTPPEFMRAITEATDPAPADRAEVQRQISSHSIRVLVYNRQNSTRDVASLVAQARAASIPVVTVTETLAPAGTTFQAWQTAQLKDLLHALGG